MDAVNQMLDVGIEKLERFIHAVDAEVEKEVNRIISEGEASREEILKDAKEESLNAAYQTLQDSIKKIYAKYVKIVAKAELDAKREVLSKRGELIDLVFENVKKALKEFAQTPQYAKFLVRLAKEQNIVPGAQICLKPEDMKYAGEIKEALGAHVEFKEDNSIKLGGICVFYPEKSLLLDKTIDLALANQKEAFVEKNCFSQDLI